MRNFNTYKKVVKKVPQSIPKVQEGGLRSFGKNTNISRFFLGVASLTAVVKLNILYLLVCLHLLGGLHGTLECTKNGKTSFFLLWFPVLVPPF